MGQTDIRRVALWVLIGSVAVTALVAMWALVFGDFDETTGRIILTSVSLAGGSLVLLAAATGWDTHLAVAASGVVGAIAGFGLVIVGVWVEPDGSLFWKVTMSSVIVGITGAWIALIGAARLSSAHRWISNGAMFSGAILALLVLTAMWLEIDESGFARLVGVAAVLAAASSVVVPVMHRLDDEPAAGVVAVTWRFCPACGAESAAQDNDRVVCQGCGARYRVDSSQ